MKLSITNSAVYGVRAGDKLQYLPELGIDALKYLRSVGTELIGMYDSV